MYTFNSIGDLQALIDNVVEEHTELEYKLCFGDTDEECNNGVKQPCGGKKKKDWRAEFVKDVSGMANANGGNIIYGIKEEKNEEGHRIPTKLEPISPRTHDCDQLTRIVTQSIRPILNVTINYLPDPQKEGGYFIVNVPKGMTAHQNLYDKRYYRRHNATVEAMEDHEIRDVMNRIKEPVVDLEFSIIKTITHRKKVSNYLAGVKVADGELPDKISYKLQYQLVNNGCIYAKYVNFFVYIPNHIIDEEVKDVEDGIACLYGDNKIFDTDLRGRLSGNGSLRYEPILPHMYGRYYDIQLKLNEEQLQDDLVIRYEIHADNAEVRSKEIKLKDIEIVQNEEEIQCDFTGHPIIVPNTDFLGL